MKHPQHYVRYAGLAVAATTALALTQLGTISTASAAEGPVTVQNRVLEVTGTASDEDIVVRFPAAGSNDVQVVLDDEDTTTVDRRTFDRVIVRGGRGDDFVDTISGAGTDPAISLLGEDGDDFLRGGTGADKLLGGAGNDVILGGGGLDRISGDSGDDVVDGESGIDTETLGSGDDTATWVPGEGNDVIHGGTGHDRLDFEGGAVDDVFRIGGTVASSVLLREPAGIKMTMDGVEKTVLGLHGGKDHVTVSGSSKPESVDVRANEREVFVTGLPLAVQLQDVDATDELQLRTGFGHDQLHLHRGAREAILIAFDLGPDQLQPPALAAGR